MPAPSSPYRDLCECGMSSEALAFSARVFLYAFGRANSEKPQRSRSMVLVLFAVADQLGQFGLVPSAVTT